MEIHLIHSDHKVKLSPQGDIGQKNGFKRVFTKKVEEISQVNSPVPIDCKGTIVEKSEGVLSLLEEYTRELADPGTSLSDIAPLVQRIKEGVSLIEAEASKEGHSDSGLGRIIRELAVTANVAVIKFHRGDYR